MWKQWTLLVLGFLLLIHPYLGFPIGFERFLSFFLSLFVMLFAFLNLRDMYFLFLERERFFGSNYFESKEDEVVPE